LPWRTDEQRYFAVKLNRRDRDFCGPHLYQPRAGLQLLLDDAFALFKRLGIDVRSISAKEFTAAYFVLAKRYHPDRGNQATHELMANINAARTTILKCHRAG
jgi:DnaJ-class molecular chaperone